MSECIRADAGAENRFSGHTAATGRCDGHVALKEQKKRNKKGRSKAAFFVWLCTKLLTPQQLFSSALFLTAFTACTGFHVDFCLIDKIHARLLE
jgi:hypothetical protein